MADIGSIIESTKIPAATNEYTQWAERAARDMPGNCMVQIHTCDKTVS